MNKHFNFKDEKLNSGFQIDMSILTEEQRLHVLQMFEARGINFPMGKPTEITFDFSKDTIIEFEKGELYHPDRKVKLTTPLIDYPTLARAAVQLEANTYAEFRINKRHELTEYAQAVGVWSNTDMPCMLFQGMGTLVYRDSTDSVGSLIPPR